MERKDKKTEKKTCQPYLERLVKGLVKENPIFVLMLALCPTMAVTTSAENALGMGVASTVVMVLANIIISALRGFIPKKVRMPSYIVIVASLTTVIQFLLEAYVPNIYRALGIYIPLIAVNCIILGRAEAYASRNSTGMAAMDALGMGLGFTGGLFAIGAVRELIGNGTLLNYRLMPDSYEPLTIFILAPGAFFVMAGLAAFQNHLRAGKPSGEESGCMPGCMGGCQGCRSGMPPEEKGSKE